MITPTTNSTTNELLSEQHYYPFGMAMNGPWVQAGEDRDLYRYNSKELNEELGLYDYGARWYDPAVGRFTTIDPHADSYGLLSPYSYVANSPIIGIDPDGRDYILIFDHENQTVTVQGTYYTQNGDDDSYKDANTATGFWNDKSGEYSYSVGKGDDAISYSVNFDLSVQSVDDPVAEANKDNAGFEVEGALNPGGGSNAYDALSDSAPIFSNKNPDAETNGATKSGDYVSVKESRTDTDTGAHEIGHNLGAGHRSSGVITSAFNSPARSGEINRATVRSTVRNAFNQKRDAKGNVRHVGAAPDHIHKSKVRRN
ncbi:RHS repeat-associated core domain-containing protein [Neolewinella litorea]|uniref:RHS repeat-associated core domain-containing protein n=1 Tax=Neolewinella litorea TaxID=2562452 RepID=UPI001455DD4D|nr:RHS repeat-associated core domain-containing protein [Neolewinella litorea]